ncbi:MAG: hypothetical protein KA911_05435, partial [Xanthomonadales bacterium]|nr:hypothetical protein [Xanthomonadales bacterium]
RAARHHVATMATMGKLEHIQHEIASLTPDELAAFQQWYAAFEADTWDRQMDRDVASGKFDAVAEAALEEHRQGKTRPL